MLFDQLPVGVFTPFCLSAPASSRTSSIKLKVAAIFQLFPRQMRASRRKRAPSQKAIAAAEDVAAFEEASRKSSPAAGPTGASGSRHLPMLARPPPAILNPKLQPSPPVTGTLTLRFRHPPEPSPTRRSHNYLTQ